MTDLNLQQVIDLNKSLTDQETLVTDDSTSACLSKVISCMSVVYRTEENGAKL